YNAFIRSDQKPNLAPYNAVTPTQSLDQVNVAPPAGIDAVLPYDDLDLVPQQLFDAALYRSVYGPQFAVPPPGPNASPLEADRARSAVSVWRGGGNVTAYLRGHVLGDADR